MKDPSLDDVRMNKCHDDDPNVRVRPFDSVDKVVREMNLFFDFFGVVAEKDSVLQHLLHQVV